MEEYIYIEYDLNNLGLTNIQFVNGLAYIDELYSYRFISNTIFRWFGKISSDGTPIFDGNPLPSTQDILDAYNASLNAYIEKEKCGAPISSYLKTLSKGYVFKTCHNVDHTSCVEILPQSNSISCNIDPTKIENTLVANNNEYINSLANLPIYHYNIVGQTHPRLFCLESDWQNVFPNSKDPNNKNIEINDVIGVMLTCIKNLNERVIQLENNK